MDETKWNQKQAPGTGAPATTAAMVTLRLFGPKYKFTEANLTDPSGDGITKKKASVRVTCNLLQTAVITKYPQGLDGKDARIWGRISGVLQEEPEEAALLESDFAWLRRLYTDESLHMPANLSQWRCALEDYLDEVRDNLRKREVG